MLSQCYCCVRTCVPHTSEAFPLAYQTVHLVETFNLARDDVQRYGGVLLSVNGSPQTYHNMSHMHAGTDSLE